MKEVKDVKSSSKGLVISLKTEATQFMPKLIEKIKNEEIDAININIKKPTLDDVFIHYTGRGLRDENKEQSPMMSMMK